ncbi:MAG: deoxyribose-phosphate aldolase [Myxococcaceae bacterium]|jgi:deoxyribose-phosphate aldolase|nr:deoxyribose-phosphate aldolase [Myxococcaceae bacterium]MCA3015423.1 deoxyribose-phosphate aldolase [Myxococcaceae bacterium]
MADDVNAIVDEITERVRRRLDAFKAGTEAPCSASPGSASSDAECAPSCAQCPNHDTCGTSLSVRTGLSSRVSPDRLRTSADIAPFIDHTLLKPEATRDEVLKLCDEAKKYGFATVCVNAINVGTAARALAGSSVMPIAVVGFPLGATTPSAKAFETREAVRCGAREIDMVVNIGALKARDHALVLHDIQLVVNAAKPVPVKVILETSQLTDDEKIVGCALSKAAGAAFVKTSTGFAKGGATVEDVALMRRIVGEDVGVKASGGVRSTDDAMKMFAAGANRIGASASIAIVTGGKSDSKY